MIRYPLRTLQALGCGHGPERAGRNEPLLPRRTGQLTTTSVPEARPLKRAKPGMIRRDLDGLRVIATLLVLGYHIGLPGMAGGFVGLDLFFVISGYLIIGLLMRQLESVGRIDWGSFFARRARRLVPAAIFMQVTVLLAGFYLFLPGDDRTHLAYSSLAALGSVANLYYWRLQPTTNYLAPATGNDTLLNTWSLSVEEQFYLALPVALLLITVITRRALSRVILRNSAVLLTVASLAFAIVMIDHTHVSKYSPMTRAYEFGIGALLALVGSTQLRRPMRELAGAAGLVALASCLVWPPSLDRYPGYWALVPTVGAALVIVAGTGNGSMLSRALSPRWLAAPAVITYAWYLWHWPLLVLARRFNLGALSPSQKVLVVLVALALATASYFVIERRFYIRGSNSAARSRPHRAIATAVAALAICALLPLGLLSHSGSTANDARWVALETAIEDYPKIPATCPEYIHFPAPGAPCVPRAVHPGWPTLFLWGDSHAWSLIPALLDAAQGKEINLRIWVSPGCPPFNPGRLDLPTGENMPIGLDSCWNQNRLAMEDMVRVADTGSPVTTMVASRWSWFLDKKALSPNERYSDSRTWVNAVSTGLVSGFPHALSVLDQSGVDALLVRPLPELPRLAPECVDRGWWFLRCDQDRQRLDELHTHANAWLDALLAAHPSMGSTTVDFTDALCTSRTCPAESDGIVNYVDDNHLSATRSAMLAAILQPILSRIAADSRGGTIPESPSAKEVS